MIHRNDDCPVYLIEHEPDLQLSLNPGLSPGLTLDPGLTKSSTEGLTLNPGITKAQPKV